MNHRLVGTLIFALVASLSTTAYGAASECRDAATTHEDGLSKQATNELQIAAKTVSVVSTPFVGSDGVPSTQLIHRYQGDVTIDLNGMAFKSDAIDVDAAKHQFSGSEITYYGSSAQAGPPPGSVVRLDNAGVRSEGCKPTAKVGTP